MFTSSHFHRSAIFALIVCKELIFWQIISRPHTNKENRDCFEGAAMSAAVVDQNKCLLCNIEEPKIEQKLTTEECVVRSLICSRIIDILSLPFKPSVKFLSLMLLLPHNRCVTQDRPNHR